MTWKELINDQIDCLKKEKTRELNRLDKIRSDDSINTFSKKVEIMANLKAIDESINTLYAILGRQSEVTE